MEVKEGGLAGWPFLVCMLEVVSFAIAALFLILKYDTYNNNTSNSNKSQAAAAADLSDANDTISMVVENNGEVLWKACHGKLNPKWLLALRALAFAYMSPLLAFNVITDGLFVFYFYTQWTFTLLIAYFGIAFYMSSKGCLHQHKEKQSNSSSTIRSSHPHFEKESANELEACYLINDNDDHVGIQAPSSVQMTKAPRVMEYAMQILFQVSAPAVLITDSVYWLILVPFFLPTSLATNFLNVNMHGVNAIFLMGEFFLNSMPFPWFRVAHFALWSILYVFFQWSLHWLGFKWWPYQFMDVSTPWAPLWYMGLIIMHLACFGVCLGVAKAKESLASCYSSSMVIQRERPMNCADIFSFICI